MSEGTIIFIYNGNQIVIPCITNEKLSLICEKFITKLQLDISKTYYYLYGGNTINKDSSFEEQANNEDKIGKVMNIVVYDEMKTIKNDNIKEAKEIICPECKESILLKIDEYRLSMYNCKNKHKIENKSIKEFNNIQKIDELKIICDICNINNKYNTYKNEMNYCLICKKIICPLCKLKHDNNHIIVKYEDRNIICSKHNEKYVKYCNDCNINLCMECIKEHKNHKGIYYGDILANIDNNNEFKKCLEKLINNINEIIKKLEEIKESMNLYYKINNNIMNNKNINYEILQNIKEFSNYNNKIIEDIKEIINENNINNKFNNIMKIYEKINNKENKIIAEIDIKEDDVNNDIRIINSFEQYKRENKWRKDKEDDYKYENEKEIKENCKIKINNEIIPFNYFYKFNKKGKYTIEYSFLSNLTKTDYMFFECKNLTDINLSYFNTQNVTNMSFMFYRCESLKNINLSNFNTQNVTNMRAMFNICKSLINIDLSSFDTHNVTNMNSMFSLCESLKDINLSNFNYQNVSNMRTMFNSCKSLININFSNFNIQNDTDIKDMLKDCKSLKKENIIINDNKILNKIKIDF